MISSMNFNMYKLNFWQQSVKTKDEKMLALNHGPLLEGVRGS